MKKKYTVTHDAYDAALTVEVDHEVLTEEKLKEINNFWASSQARLRDADGNVLHAVLKRLAELVLWMDLSGSPDLAQLIKGFDWQDASWGGVTEGWPKMDGSEGIRLIAVDSLRIDYDEMTVEEVS